MISELSKPLSEIEKAELGEVLKMLSNSPKWEMLLRRAYFEIDSLKAQLEKKNNASTTIR